MKGNNTTGMIIILGILIFATIKSFDIHIGIENIKVIGAVGISIVVGILLFFGMQSKKPYNPDYYKEEEKEEEKPSDDNVEQDSYIASQHYQEGDTSYSSYNNPNNSAQQNYQPEEDNRWS